ncbi:MAG: hypothetical protein JJE25_10915 [Bacteroidia bacterium]|nr:hypothetical protein [Bacteroidia bacterium]
MAQGPNWRTNGNNISSTDVIGSNNAQDLRIISNGTQKAVITTSGNVGIGTASPANTLEVSGSTSKTGNFINTSVSEMNYGLFTSCNNTAGYGIGMRAEGGFTGINGLATMPGNGD